MGGWGGCVLWSMSFANGSMMGLVEAPLILVL